MVVIGIYNLNPAPLPVDRGRLARDLPTSLRLADVRVLPRLPNPDSNRARWRRGGGATARGRAAPGGRRPGGSRPAPPQATRDNTRPGQPLALDVSSPRAGPAGGATSAASKEVMSGPGRRIIAEVRTPPSYRPGLLTRPMRAQAQIKLGAFASCARVAGVRVSASGQQGRTPDGQSESSQTSSWSRSTFTSRDLSHLSGAKTSLLGESP